jgi:hypothetical protein
MSIIANVYFFRLEPRNCDQTLSEQGGQCHVNSGCDLFF